MYDRYNRKINYLRISVTDRCNLRCSYCMPEEGVKQKSHDEILRFEEIIDVVRAGVRMGISKVRLTGGEPLVRKGVTELVRELCEMEGIEDVGMTTNGILLKRYGQELWDAGLRRLNISLDTLDPEKYHTVTRVGNLKHALDGILHAKELGFDPMKINFVKLSGSDDADRVALQQFCDEHGFQLRVIRQMNLSSGEFYRVEGGEGGNCKLCNRLRLTADGNIVPCLFSDFGYNVRELGVEEAFNRALRNKPKSGKVSVNHQFYNIGG